jgi:hypothetical protein
MEVNLYTPNFVYSSLDHDEYDFSKTWKDNFIKFSKFVNDHEFILITDNNEIILNEFNDSFEVKRVFTAKESHFIYDFDM